MQESPVDSQSEAQVTPELAVALKPQGGRRFVENLTCGSSSCPGKQGPIRS